MIYFSTSVPVFLPQTASSQPRPNRSVTQRGHVALSPRRREIVFYHVGSIWLKNMVAVTVAI